MKKRARSGRPGRPLRRADGKSPRRYNGVDVVLQAIGKGGSRATHQELADLLGITRGAVSLWDGVIPHARVVQISKKTGVPRHLLRPDLYDPPTPLGSQPAA